MTIKIPSERPTIVSYQQGNKWGFQIWSTMMDMLFESPPIYKNSYAAIQAGWNYRDKMPNSQEQK